MESVDKGGEGEMLNLIDYLFLRRVKVGWDKCGAGNGLSVSYVPCALRIAVPNWVADITVATQIANLAIILKYGYTN